MVMHRPPNSSSAGIRRIRRELQHRRSKPLAPTGSVAKNPSASPPPPPPRHGSSSAVREPRQCPPHRASSITSHSRGSAVTDASPQSRPRASLRCITASPPPPPPRSVPASSGSASQETPGVAALLSPGTVVGVRTRTTTLKTGQVLVLWLKATVVSSTSHGGYEVVYDGSRPSGDPKGTVRVARHHVRVIKISPSPTTPPLSLRPPTATVAAAAQKEATLPPVRPTTTGKSVRVIRSLLPEMEQQARAPLSGIGY